MSPNLQAKVSLNFILQTKNHNVITVLSLENGINLRFPNSIENESFWIYL